MTRQPIFMECGRCGERWKAATFPLPLERIVRLTSNLMCPNCGEGHDVKTCGSTVCAPRDGADVDASGNVLAGTTVCGD